MAKSETVTANKPAKRNALSHVEDDDIRPTDQNRETHSGLTRNGPFDALLSKNEVTGRNGSVDNTQQGIRRSSDRYGERSQQPAERHGATIVNVQGSTNAGRQIGGAVCWD